MTWLALAVSSSPDRAACLLFDSPPWGKCRREARPAPAALWTTHRELLELLELLTTTRRAASGQLSSVRGAGPAVRGSARPRHYHGARQPRRGCAGARARHGAGLAAGTAACLREPAAGHFEEGGKSSLCAVCTQLLAFLVGPTVDRPFDATEDVMSCAWFVLWRALPGCCVATSLVACPGSSIARELIPLGGGLAATLQQSCLV